LRLGLSKVPNRVAVSPHVRTDTGPVSEKLFSCDRLWSLVVRVPGYRRRGPGSIPGATRFPEKHWVKNGVHSALRAQLSSNLEEKSGGSGLENRDYDRRGFAPLTTDHSSYPQRLNLTLPTSGSRSIGIVHSWTRSLLLYLCVCVCVFLYPEFRTMGPETLQILRATRRQAETGLSVRRP
jgi:hypothetical protein